MTDDDKTIDGAIQGNIKAFQKPGVLTLRPGYEIAGGQLTGRRAIVATVRSKTPRSNLPEDQILPEEVGGIPVDVRHASAYQRLRASDPLAAATSRLNSRPEDNEPSWPLEREAASGELLASEDSQSSTRFAAQNARNQAGAAALALASGKPQLPYKPDGSCPALTQRSITANVTTAVSPGCGFATLSTFMQGVRTGVKIGMYDFTSDPILQLFETTLAAPKTLQMVLDSPAPNPTSDQTDLQTVQDLKAKLGGRATIARALTRGDHYASRWSFPYAYHIKVIVRDGAAMWLSSGNLNNSNEPAPNHPKTAEDRDWHIVIDNEELSALFAAYLDFDYKTAAANQAAPDGAQAALEDANRKKALQSDPPGVRPYSSQGQAPSPAPAPVPNSGSFPGLTFTVTPLLTPDLLAGGGGEYLAAIIGLISGAKTSIDIQLQYIEASSGKEGDPYQTLLAAIAERIASGIAVRLIVSADYAEKWGEKMKSQGVDLTANLRTQPSVHNKGFIIDSGKIVVSSQNFSPAGVSQNRDAGLLIESKELAGYFQPVFDADWTGARPFVAGS